nr:DNA directed RNA polymerases I, II, and III [Hymenolepis microstoma]
MQKELEQTLEDFKESLGDTPSRKELLVVVNHEEDPSDMLYVFFPDEDRVNMKTIRAYVDQMQHDSCTKAILVLREVGLTPAAKSAIAELLANKITMECFYENELMVNITEHKLVPEHRVLTADEKQQLLDARLKESQLPKMQSSDPVARYYGLKRGQVVRINRPSETAGRYITYRIVV